MNLTVRDVQDSVGKYFKLHRDVLLSNSRARKIARPRQIAMYLARKYTLNSYPDLGMRFYRDHSTIVHAFHRIRALRIEDPTIGAMVQDCEDILNNTVSWRVQAAQNIASQPLVISMSGEAA